MYTYYGKSLKVAVVVPAYRVRDTLFTVVSGVPNWVDHVIVVDDCCPERSFETLISFSDARLEIIKHPENRGVGGAMISGFKRAIHLRCDIVAKMDGDNQMDPDFLADLINPIAAGICDFSKGNRFIHIEELGSMPPVRRLGNIGLTFLTKLASGHWHISDPTNGFIAVHSHALSLINLDRLSKRYFFETSFLIYLNIIKATALDIPIPAKYAGEKSSLSIARCLIGFPPRLAMGTLRRALLKYCFYDVNATTFCLLFGLILTTCGGAFGVYRWTEGAITGHEQSAGTVALALLPCFVGLVLLLQGLILDVIDKPTIPISRVLERRPISLKQRSAGNNT